MKIDGTLTKTDDGAYVGWIASLTFDVDLTLTPNPYKSKDAHPDLQITGATPRGRKIRIGSGWERTSRAGNAYLSLIIDVNGEAVNANGHFDEKAGEYTVKEWAD